MKKEQEPPTSVVTYEAFAFVKDRSGGNGAGVTLETSHLLTKEQRQAIATKLRYSESAFVLTSEEATYRVLFFTPTKQVPMCGHATIAAWHTLFEQGLVSAGRHTQEIQLEDGSTQVLRIDINEEGVVFTELSKPEFKELIDSASVATMFKIDAMSLGINEHLPQIVNTSYDDAIIPINNLQTFNTLRFETFEPDEVIAFQKQHGVEGLHFFYFEQSDVLAIKVKNTDPINGIFPYDNATGTSNGALVSYLYSNKLITREQAVAGITITQIGNHGTVSEVIARLVISDSGEILEVWVGGRVESKK